MERSCRATHPHARRQGHVGLPKSAKYGAGRPPQKRGALQDSILLIKRAQGAGRRAQLLTGLRDLGQNVAIQPPLRTARVRCERLLRVKGRGRGRGWRWRWGRRRWRQRLVSQARPRFKTIRPLPEEIITAISSAATRNGPP